MRNSFPRLSLLSSLVILVASGFACGSSTPTTQVTHEAPPPEPPPEEPEEVALEEGPTPANGRLPEGTRPRRYSLALSINPAQAQFGGVARIDVQVDSPRSVLWLHGRELNVSSAIATDENGEVAGTWRGQEGQDDDTFASVTFPREVSGNVELVISYAAPFGTTLKGLYKVTHDGADYIFTQMEPLDARAAFPSFDEPQFKTPIDLTLRVPADMEAVANTRAVSENIDGDWKTVRFATSLPMPTYLLALAVGPLDIVEGEAISATDVRSEALPFRGIAPRGRGEELAYTLENTAALLLELEDYFGIAYPYDKLDVVAVPDFAAGAMENIGLVTFRDTILLVDEDSSLERRRFWAFIMAHELAHMWFGNLVTMEWWDDLWLNEAFASWMEYKAAAGVFPDYESNVELSAWVQSVYANDALASARAIRQPIESSHDVHNAFNGITYGKGAGVLRMFEQYLGEEVFREGVRAYMRAHRLENATQDDLFAALSEASGQDMASAIGSFVSQPGLPSVSATLSCGDDGAQVTLAQTRYAPVGSTASQDSLWQIPVCVRYPKSRRETAVACTLLTSREGNLALEEATRCPSWIHPNADGRGYYRWSLEDDALAALMGARSTLSVEERLSLADSVEAAFNSANTEAGPVGRSLLALARDESQHVATSGLGFFVDLLHNMAGENDERLRARINRAYATDARRLGWTAGRREDEAMSLRRGALVPFLTLHAQNERLLQSGARAGAAYLQVGTEEEGVNREAVAENVAAAAVAAAVRADSAAFARAMELLETETDGQVRRALLSGIGWTNREAEMEAALALVLSGELRVNELFTIPARLFRNETREVAWTWLQENYERLAERLPAFYAGYLPKLLAGQCSEEAAREVDAFFRERVQTLPGGPRNLDESVEAIRLCAARVEAQGEGAETYLSR